MMNEKKDFDAVKMMREIREKLRKKYEADPGLREKDLEEIHTKYHMKKRKGDYSSRSRGRGTWNAGGRTTRPSI